MINILRRVRCPAMAVDFRVHYGIGDGKVDYITDIGEFSLFDPGTPGLGFPGQ